MAPFPRVSTRTFTYTRMEALEDQFEHFLRFGGIVDDSISAVRTGVQNRQISSVGLYALNPSGYRILEIALSVDWGAHGTLVLQQPYISQELSGWDGTMSPEVKVAGRRFAEAAQNVGATPLYWVAWLRTEWATANGFAGSIPGWAGQVEERSELLYDLGEATIYIRAATNY